MRVLLSTYGSRGDVEPMAALAVQLQTLGVEAVVSAPPDPEFVELLARAGVPLAPASCRSGNGSPSGRNQLRRLTSMGWRPR